MKKNNSKKVLLIAIFCALFGALYAVQRFSNQQNMTGSPRQIMSEALAETMANVKLDERGAAYFQLEYAIRHYKIVHMGKAPSSYQDLIPAYFDSVPIDPQTKNPFPIPFAMGGRGNSVLANKGIAASGGAAPADNSSGGPASSQACPAGLVRNPKYNVCVVERKEAPTPLPSPSPTDTTIRDFHRG